MRERSGFRADRVRLEELIIGVMSLALLIDLFLPWYSERDVFVDSGPNPGYRLTLSAIHAYHVLGVYALICALLGLCAVAAQATLRGPAVPLCLTVIASLLDVILLIALILRVVFFQRSYTFPNAPHTNIVSLDVPAVVGVFLTAGMLIGTWLSLRTDGIAPADAPRRIETLRLTQRRA